MRTRPSARAGAHAPGLVAATVALLALAPGVAREAPTACERALAEEPSVRADCCFTNRGFTGVCRVKPVESETCVTILAYLNNPQSQGKDYCGGTAIRGGWQELACEVPRSGGPVESR